MSVILLSTDKGESKIKKSQLSFLSGKHSYIQYLHRKELPQIQKNVKHFHQKFLKTCFTLHLD